MFKMAQGSCKSKSTLGGIFRQLLIYKVETKSG